MNNVRLAESMATWAERWIAVPARPAVASSPSPIAGALRLPSPPRSNSHRPLGQALSRGLPLPLVWGFDSHRSALIGGGARLSAAGSHCPLSGGATPIVRLSSAEGPGSRLRAPIARCLGVRLLSAGAIGVIEPGP